MSHPKYRCHYAACTYWSSTDTCDCEKHKPPMPKHELEKDLPAYLVFSILRDIKCLRELEPGHVLVKAIDDVFKPPDDSVDAYSHQLDLFD